MKSNIDAKRIIEDTETWLNEIKAKTLQIESALISLKAWKKEMEEFFGELK